MTFPSLTPEERAALALKGIVPEQSYHWSLLRVRSGDIPPAMVDNITGTGPRRYNRRLEDSQRWRARICSGRWQPIPLAVVIP